DAPKGSINGTLRNFTIYDNDQLDKAAPWNNVVIAYKNGAPVRIRDIGKAVLSVPPSIKIEQVVDRTTTIKASVRDVEFTLLLTIALVVMVIFLFLRN